MSRIINQVLEYHTGVDLYDIHPEMTLESLGADSLDCIEICMDLEDKFGIKVSDEELHKLVSVQDVYDVVNQKQDEKQKHLSPPENKSA